MNTKIQMPNPEYTLEILKLTRQSSTASGHVFIYSIKYLLHGPLSQTPGRGHGCFEVSRSAGQVCEVQSTDSNLRVAFNEGECTYLNPEDLRTLNQTPTGERVKSYGVARASEEVSEQVSEQVSGSTSERTSEEQPTLDDFEVKIFEEMSGSFLIHEMSERIKYEHLRDALGTTWSQELDDNYTAPVYLREKSTGLCFSLYSFCGRFRIGGRDYNGATRLKIALCDAVSELVSEQTRIEYAMNTEVQTAPKN